MRLKCIKIRVKWFKICDIFGDFQLPYKLLLFFCEIEWSTKGRKSSENWKSERRKQHMQNSLLCYTTTGNGSRWFSSVYHCKTIDFTICFAVRTQSFAHNVTRRRCRHCSIVQCCTTCVLCEHCQEMEEFFNGCSILHNGRK